ncbi:uncharacterized protein BX664DRAFT_331189 [Halteromyces radiatus]|uniref:uncharacterized protein n=1 Tax=Halteromyces radiatus TaxID=101107 RepID=UPI00221F6AB6|nr:uncharacterized protein BX664DRAFT_331189 [Halteromyces radiatus]KAI8088710.1 hypothetical protein BX664DRAFT_331189 [Halteromyces radiatus]
MPFNSPLPASLGSECRKASRILNSFIDPGEGLDKIIPSGILRNAKGLAILTVLKGGFLFSGRAGSGLVIARLADGSWSAPSAIGTLGMGFGGQIGGELTDFVMVLQTQAAVKAFMSFGNLTLGGNISVAAGPVGRNAEASGTASIKSVAAIYSYSKTRGLFAGVSLEGSVIMERFDANAKMYGYKVKARDLLGGSVPPPSEASSLYQALDNRFRYDNNSYYDFRQQGYHQPNNSSYNYDTRDFDSGYNASNGTNGLGRSQTFSRAAVKSMATGGGGGGLGTMDYGRRSRSSSTTDRWQQSSPRFGERDDDILGLPDTTPTGNSSFNSNNRPVITDGKPRARALFNFAGQQAGDLPFKKGDTIVIVKKSETQQDWWTGEIGSRKGIFPANFVELI